jgi:hypothetical protein
MLREWAMGMASQGTLEDVTVRVNETGEERYAWESRDL